MSQVEVIEVGPRDGLQNEPATIPTEVKIAFIDALSKVGMGEIEASAFVSPKWVPQLSDASDVFAQIVRAPNRTYSALVPNEKGMERALKAGIKKIAVFTAASEAFNQKNINTSIEGAFERFKPVLALAEQEKVTVRAYVSTAFHCPYQGKVIPQSVRDVALSLLDLGADELSFGDTIGKADPDEVKVLLDVLQNDIASHRIAMHFHDTYGKAKENVRQAFRMGILRFDSSAGGIGGCPYAPGASGNISTESVARTIEAEGGTVGIDYEALHRARSIVLDHLSHAMPTNPTPT